MTDEQKKDLYYRQKETFDQFLSTGAITRAQYEKSLGDLTRKMGMENDAVIVKEGFAGCNQNYYTQSKIT